MAIVIVDGISIDTTIWIDVHIAGFKDQEQPLGARIKLLAKEIEMRKSDLQTFTAHDIQGRAHLKAYIQELEQEAKALADDWGRKVKETTEKKD